MLFYDWSIVFLLDWPAGQRFLGFPLFFPRLGKFQEISFACRLNKPINLPPFYCTEPINTISRGSHRTSSLITYLLALASLQCLAPYLLFFPSLGSIFYKCSQKGAQNSSPPGRPPLSLLANWSPEMLYRHPVLSNYYQGSLLSLLAVMPFSKKKKKRMQSMRASCTHATFAAVLESFDERSIWLDEGVLEGVPFFLE